MSISQLPEPHDVVVMPTIEETLAIAICNGFWETAELPERWSTSSENKREVFRNCARWALAAGRAFRVARGGRP